MLTRMTRRVCWILIVLTTLTAGCSTTSVVDEWREPTFAAAPYQNVLVVALGKRADLRRRYESEFVRELRERGAHAVEGHLLLPDNTDEVDREALQNVVAESGADAVVITRLVKMEERVVGAAPTYTPPTTSLNQFYVSSWTRYYEPAGPPGGGLQAYVQTIATLETSVFDAKNSQLVWRATTETIDADSAQHRVPDLVKTLIEAMAKAKVIQ